MSTPGAAALDDQDRRCVGCGATSPKTESDYTLISARFGWRLSLKVEPGGRRVPEWHCPDCWAKQKKRAE